MLRATGVATLSVGTLTIAGCTSENELADDSSDGGDDSGDSSESAGLGRNADSGELGFEIEYCCSWSGSLTSPSSSRSIDGTGTQTGRVYPAPDYLGLTAQKRSSGMDVLTARIFYEGDVLNEGSTSAEYGVVSINVSK
jgi:hypothetical protein